MKVSRAVRYREGPLVAVLTDGTTAVLDVTFSRCTLRIRDPAATDSYRKETLLTPYPVGPTQTNVVAAVLAVANVLEPALYISYTHESLRPETLWTRHGQFTQRSADGSVTVWASSGADVSLCLSPHALTFTTTREGSWVQSHSARGMDQAWNFAYRFALAVQCGVRDEYNDGAHYWQRLVPVKRTMSTAAVFPEAADPTLPFLPSYGPVAWVYQDGIGVLRPLDTGVVEGVSTHDDSVILYTVVNDHTVSVLQTFCSGGGEDHREEHRYHMDGNGDGIRVTSRCATYLPQMSRYASQLLQHERLCERAPVERDKVPRLRSSLVYHTRVEGIGTFNAFSDRSVRGVFDDRHIGTIDHWIAETPQDVLVRFITPYGEQHQVRVGAVLTDDTLFSYVCYLSHFAFFAFHDEETRSRLLVGDMTA